MSAPSADGATASAAAAAAERRRQEHLDRQHGAKGAGTNFLTLAGQTSLLLFQLLGARLFGPATWGAYAFGLSVLEILGRLSLAGSDKGILIFVAARRATGDVAGADRAIATGVRLSLVIGVGLAIVVAAASGAIGAYYDEPSFAVALRYLSPAIPMIALTTVLLAATMALKTLRYNLLVKGMTEPGLRVALVAIAGVTMSGVAPLASVHVAAAAGTVAVAIWSFSRLYHLRHTLERIARAPFDGPMVKYAIPLAAAEFVNSFLAQTNVLILGKFRAAEEVGIYAACVVLATAVSFIRGAFDTVLAPVAAEAWAKGDRPRLASNVKLYSRLVLLFATPLCSLFVVGGPALLELHGPAFVRGSVSLAILAFGHLLNASLGLVGWVLLASRRSKTVLLNNVAVFALNVVLCVVLVPKMGMAGAALAATLSIVALHTAQSLVASYLARAHPISRGFVVLLLLGAAIIAGELVASRMMGGSSWVRALVPLFIGTPLFFAGAWALSSREERGLLKTMVLRRSPPA